MEKFHCSVSDVWASVFTFRCAQNPPSAALSLIRGKAPFIGERHLSTLTRGVGIQHSEVGFRKLRRLGPKSRVAIPNTGHSVHSDEYEDKLRALADRAVAEYLKVQPFYGELADVVARIIKESLENGGVKIHSVQFRTKDAKSFSNKAATPSDENPTEPKYSEPIKQITDLAGVRVITHFLSTLADVDSMLNSEFEVVEKSNKGMLLIASDRFGYQSIHYLVKLRAARSCLPEYRRFAGHLVEVQVRTILQHAWAEIEHDIQYKSSITIPTEIRRRFVALAGMLEIADREFQAIDDANKALETTAKTSVEAGNLSGIEITPNSLKLFLDKKLGPDGRMSDWSYEWTTRLLKSLGFRELSEVEKAIEPYDDHKLSVIDSGTRRGQLARFEIMLHAALGEQWGDRHPWQDPFWIDVRRKSRDRFEKAGVPLGTYKIDRPSQPFR
jgi:putative GTP pyrophosphokinase